MKKKGIFCISLDFELYWGIQDKKTIAQYGDNILGAWQVVPRLLELFKKNNIHATWAMVGAMLCRDAAELQEMSPSILPQYQQQELSPYEKFYTMMKEVDPRYLFGNELFNMVKNTPFQELGTHTFSHYYCLEEGQNKEAFISDLQACISISIKNGFNPKAFIFPRHQLNLDYIKEFSKFGIETYRGTEEAWYNSPSKSGEEGIIKRIFRFADYFLPMFSQHCQDLQEVKRDHLYQIRASRWLRPYAKKWEKLDGLKLSRIKSQMSYAARNGKIFHLWFHPHDIGADIDKNFEYLEKIMLHYQYLHRKYEFQSLNFAEIKNQIDENCSVYE